MSKITIFHNPRCRKSREAVKLINEHKIPNEIRNYIAEPLEEKELKEAIDKLGISAENLLRKKEKDYKEQVAGSEHSEEELINLMIKYPKLMQRPILIRGDKAVVGRPTEKVYELIGE